MADIVSRAKRSQMMAAVKGKDSKMEILFRKEFWRKGFRYRKHPSNYFGKPDLVLRKYKIVIFLDSCFWHACAKHCRIPSTNQEFWSKKFERNIERDREVTKYYLNTGWNPIRFWEHDI